jgi:hypothetical protein
MNFKSRVFSVIFLTLTSFSVWAYLPVNPLITVFPLQVSAQVYNPYYEPIACSGQVFGRTAYGQQLTSFFPHQIIPAGQVRYAYVYTNAMNPFVTGFGNVFCNFLR